MEKFDNILKVCKKFGYKGDENICDFWFNNQKKLQEYFYGPKTYSTTIPSQLRWKSEFGIQYQQAIRNYIEGKVEANWTALNNSAKSGHLSLSTAVIDFKD